MDLHTKNNLLNETSLRDYLREKAASAYIPSSVYRIQLNPHFSFRQAAACVPYWKALGIDAIYCSPYLQARPGSLHGYDITNPHRINPELGSEDDFKFFCDELKRHHMGQIMDVVPNHMGIVGNTNFWWMDVLENGPSSVYARFFDIDWRPKKSELENKVLIPLLGDHYGRVLENKEIQLTFGEGEFWVGYHEHRLPVAPGTYPLILEYGIEQFKTEMKDQAGPLQEFLSIITAFRNLPPRTEKDPDKIHERIREKEVAKTRLKKLTEECPAVRGFIEGRVRLFNGEPGHAKSFDLLDELLNSQAYRLAFWKVAAEEINYRRFFDINDLAAIRMEDHQVFEVYHQFIFRLIAEGKVQGLRIDHPDGLYDPPSYFEKLQRKCLQKKVEGELGLKLSGREEEDGKTSAALERLEKMIAQDEALISKTPFFTVVEKILDRKESLPEDWDVHGTVGYDFLNALDGVFVDQNQDKAFGEIYEHFIGHTIDFDRLLYDKKKFFALVHMSSEINNLAYILDKISENNRRYRDFTLNNLTVAIREMIACFPVYRTYISPDAVEVSERDEKYIRIAAEKAKRKTPALSHALYDFLRDILLLKLVPEMGREEERRYRDFILRFQQLTGPVMAKGYEDTSFYIYNRLLSLNEVGGEPLHFGTSVGDFHRQNIERNKRWPASFLASSTHDTKRSEDMRMRIHALSEMPKIWKTQIARWATANEKHKTEIEGVPEPRRNTEYAIYQTLLGVWPLEGLQGKNAESLRKRVWTYTLKAVREGKIYTNWVNPNTEYEEAVRKFVYAILTPAPANRFLKLFVPFQKRISRLGMLNSLSALVLKLGSPGVADTYQGNEIWNYRMVDPDNRASVDYRLRRGRLSEIEAVERPKRFSGTFSNFLKDPTTGTLKMFLLFQMLRARSEYPELFLGGDYVPLRAAGEKERHVVAFLRKRNGKTAMVAAGRFFHGLLPEKMKSIKVNPAVWDDTRLILPKELAQEKDLINRFTGKKVPVRQAGGESVLMMKDVFRELGAALFLQGRNGSPERRGGG